MRIVIVGGGIAGIELATRLGRASRRHGQQVMLADRSLSHVWKPTLHTFAAGTARPERELVSFLAQARRSGFTFTPGELVSVDRATRQVELRTAAGETGAATTTIAYDVLVLAIGSRANDFHTPGVGEHCSTIDDLEDAAAFRSKFARHALRQSEAIEVAIVGGGATGVELAAELKYALNLLSDYHAPGLKQAPRLTLIESGGRLLPAFPDPVASAATATLRKLGVEVLTGAEVTGADANGFALKGGGRVNASLTVWAAGVKGPAILGSIEGLETSKHGQLVISPTLQTTKDPAIFVIGDSASLIDPATKKPVPSTAQAARQQALHLASSLANWRGKEALPSFRDHDKGAIVSLADFNGWATLGRHTLGGGVFKGLSARAAHELLYRQHQIELFGFFRGLSHWLADDVDRSTSPKIQLD